MDLMEGPPVLFTDIWTRFSATGTVGDPTLATAEKGRLIYEAVVDALVRLVREFKNRPAASQTPGH